MIDPSTYLAKETLKDGTEVTVRAIRREDSGSILESFKTLDREAIYRRFFSPKKELSDAELKQLTDVDFSRVVALVVTTGRVTQHNHLNTWGQHSEKLLVVKSIDGAAKDELVSHNLPVHSSNGRAEQQQRECE